MNRQNYSNNNNNSKMIEPSLFASNSKAEPTYHSDGDSQSYEYWKEKKRQFEDERYRIEKKTLESSKESLGLICESEKIGLNSAHQLVRQREKLNKVEENLDSMNGTLRVSQNHLTSIKSIFGGFKNYFSRNKNLNSKKPDHDSHDHNSFIDTIEEIQTTSSSHSYQNNTAFRQRNQIDFKLADKEHYVDEHIENTGYCQRSGQIDEAIEQNLNEIDLGVGRLKQLSLSLGNEIDSQNSLLERITKEAERTELTLKHQNTQLNKVLRK